MSRSSSKFTDNNLKVFYSNLLNHYQDCMTRSLNANESYLEMFTATQYSLESGFGSLFHLEHDEKIKVYQAFNSIFYALPLYRELPKPEQQKFRPEKPAYKVINNYNYPRCYNTNYNDPLLTWMLLSNLTHHCDYRRGRSIPYPSSGGSVHSHPSKNSSGNKSNNDAAQLIAALVLIALVAAVAALAFIALFYMIHQSVNSVERLYYNEGWLKAALMLATSVAFGSASTLFALFVVSAPLMALAVAAGFNPIGILIIGTVSLAVVGAGIATFVTSLIYDSTEKKVSKDSIDPSDVNRFRLTASEETALIKKGIDPIKVKCAIVALRAEMSKELESDKAIPSFFSRHFWDGSKVQPLLDQVRQLRSGAITEVPVGSLHFDCRVPQVYYPYQRNDNAQQPPNFFPQPYNSQIHKVAYTVYVLEQLPEGYGPSAPPIDSFESEHDNPIQSYYS